MATLPDVSLIGTTYQDLYSETGIEFGLSVTIQNKTAKAVYLQNTSTVPDDNSSDGHLLGMLETIIVAGVIEGLWAKGNGPISVEIVT